LDFFIYTRAVAAECEKTTVTEYNDLAQLQLIKDWIAQMQDRRIKAEAGASENPRLHRVILNDLEDDLGYITHTHDWLQDRLNITPAPPQEPITPPQATEPPVEPPQAREAPVIDPRAAASAFGDAVDAVKGVAKDLWDAHYHHHRNKGAERPFSLVTAYKAAWQAAVNLWPFEGRATSSADIDQARETPFGRFALMWMDILHPDKADQEIENRVTRSISDEEKRRIDEATRKERLRLAEIRLANEPKSSPYEGYNKTR
jgi:hypothetical protein